MSFKSKFKKQAIQKIDNLVETPNYISSMEISKKPRKLSLSWLKFAVPALLVTAIVATPIIFAVTTKNSSSKSGDSSYDILPDQEGGGEAAPSGTDSESSQYADDGSSPVSSLSLRFNGNEYTSANKSRLALLSLTAIKMDLTKPVGSLLGEKIGAATIENSSILFDGGYFLYHLKNSNSNLILLAYNGEKYVVFVVDSLAKDMSFESLLNFSGIDNNYRLQVYDIGMNLLHTFKDEKATTIFESLKSTPSTNDEFNIKYASATKDTKGNITGNKYIFVFSDGLDCVAGEYYSQITYLDIFSSNFDLSGTTCYSTINEVISLS